MGKELSFDMKPLIKSYQYYAYPLGILKSNNYKNYEKCILNNFKTIFYAATMQFYVDEYEYWNVFEIEWKENFDPKKAFAEIVRAIDNNQYVHLRNIDEYYIPSRVTTAKYHFLHDILIIGYENDKVIGVGYDDKGVYNKEKFSINRLSNSFTAKTEVRLLKVKDSILELDYNEILESLEDYFASKSMLCIFKTKNTILDNDSWIYGINAMEKFILKMRKMEKDPFVHDLLLCIECKQLVLNKIEKIKVYFNNSLIMDEYQEIIEKYKIVRLKIIKKIVKEENFNEELEQLEQVYYKEKQFADKWKTEVFNTINQLSGTFKNRE